MAVDLTWWRLSPMNSADEDLAKILLTDDDP